MSTRVPHAGFFYHTVVHISSLVPTMFSLPVRVQTLTAPELEMATTTSSVNKKNIFFAKMFKKNTHKQQNNIICWVFFYFLFQRFLYLIYKYNKINLWFSDINSFFFTEMKITVKIKKCSLQHFQVTIPLQTDRPSFVTGWRIQHALIQSGATFDDSVYRISRELGLMMNISG